MDHFLRLVLLKLTLHQMEPPPAIKQRETTMSLRNLSKQVRKQTLTRSAAPDRNNRAYLPLLWLPPSASFPFSSGGASHHRQFSPPEAPLIAHPFRPERRKSIAWGCRPWTSIFLFYHELYEPSIFGDMNANFCCKEHSNMELFPKFQCRTSNDRVRTLPWRLYHQPTAPPRGLAQGEYRLQKQQTEFATFRLSFRVKTSSHLSMVPSNLILRYTDNWWGHRDNGDIQSFYTYLKTRPNLRTIPFNSPSRSINIWCVHMQKSTYRSHDTAVLEWDPYF